LELANEAAERQKVTDYSKAICKLNSGIVILQELIYEVLLAESHADDSLEHSSPEESKDCANCFSEMDSDTNTVKGYTFDENRPRFKFPENAAED
jgi:hypothetical protein